MQVEAGVPTLTTLISKKTISTFARSIFFEAEKYGFKQVDVLRLINELMDLLADIEHSSGQHPADMKHKPGKVFVNEFPLRSNRLKIRRARPEIDLELLMRWLDDQYGRHFLLSSATAQAMDLDALLHNPRNEVGIVLTADDEPIGSVAFLDVDKVQRRAELRKVIGVSAARGIGYAEEATRMWIQYGGQILALEKIYVSTLQTHLRNIRLNESIGFKVEGLLQREVRIGDERHDVLRMGLVFEEFCKRLDGTK